jgi:hypothetical protein
MPSLNTLRQKLGYLFFAVSSASIATPTQATAIDCPLEIDKSAFSAVREPAGWSAFVTKSLMLQSAGVTDGRPDELGQLKPVSTAKEAHQTVVVYRFPKENTQNLWVSCSYITGGGPIVLARKIELPVTKCAAIYSHPKGHLGGISVKCE